MSNTNFWQMPIWSLTKERVEKLLKAVGDKEIEIDTLIKLTKEDLWTRDLDDFLAEWRFQLDDEAKRQKKVANMGRRASKKLNIAGGVAGRKRKNDSDDDDFDVAPVKAKKTAMPKKEVGGLLSYMMPQTKTKTSPKAKAKAPTATQKAAKKALDLISTSAKEEDKDDVWMNLDGSGSDAPKVSKPKAAHSKMAPPKKKAEPVPKEIDSDDDEENADEEIIRPTASRRPRGVAAKPISYNIDGSDSDGDDMLFDVGKMVKGINTASVPADNSRPLFSASMSRPGSSAGLPKKSTSSKPAVDVDSDDTNYSKLAPPTTKKGPTITARKTILSDDDDESLDEMIAVPPKAAKPASKASAKPGPKAKAAAPAKKVTKAAPPPPEPKKMPLSPAAKAYAAKKAKAEKAALKASSLSDDELDGLANEIMGDDDDEEDEEEVGGPAARRPARRAASAAPKKNWVISDDEDEVEESTMQFDGGDSDD